MVHSLNAQQGCLQATYNDFATVLTKSLKRDNIQKTAQAAAKALLLVAQGLGTITMMVGAVWIVTATVYVLPVSIALYLTGVISTTASLHTCVVVPLTLAAIGACIAACSELLLNAAY